MKGVVIPATQTELVQAFFNAQDSFIKATWSAKRGETVTTVNKKGETRTSPKFDIVIQNVQMNGQPEVGSVVLVSKSKGGVELFRLTEQLESNYKSTPQGVGITTWSGELVTR